LPFKNILFLKCVPLLLNVLYIKLQTANYVFPDISTHNKNVQEFIVNEHNTLRRNVSPPAGNMLKMEWNQEAAENSERWAQLCTENHSSIGQRQINSNTESPCGENTVVSLNPISWEEVIQMWNDEVHNFKYGVGSKDDSFTGHYTQIVWYRSNKIGCAVAHCSEAKYAYFYVCHYCPPGNYQDSLFAPYKSGPPCKDCPHSCEEKLCTNACPYVDKYRNCAPLKEEVGCSNEEIFQGCPASCKCSNQIM
uniref:Cysteine rich secretory protein 1 n=1 Tax=Lepisosteus oculatus TaxID=7918 RepID=W5NHS6_LEPOC